MTPAVQELITILQPFAASTEKGVFYSNSQKHLRELAEPGNARRLADAIKAVKAEG